MNQRYSGLFDIGSEIVVGKIYQHYSGKLYNIIALARDHHDPELLHVVYQGLYECPSFGPCPIWVRPYHDFVQIVDIDGIKRPRFVEVV